MGQEIRWPVPQDLFFGGRELLQELCGILVKILLAAFAAQLDFLILVNKGERLTHLAQFFTGDDAGFQWVGLGLGSNRGCGFCGGAATSRQRAIGSGEFGRERGDAENGDGQKDDLIRFFHR